MTGNVQMVSVTVSGVLKPSDDDFIAVFTPKDASSKADTDDCPSNGEDYIATGDLASQPYILAPRWSSTSTSVQTRAT